MPSAEPGSGQDRRRNYLILLLHGLLGQTGFRLLQAPTFLPSYIHLLAGNSFAVGAASACQSLGMFLSPMFAVGIAEHRRRVKPLTFVFGGLMRSMVLALTLVALFAPIETALWLVWPILISWGIANGLQMVVFNVLFAKTVPTQERGRLQGVRNLTSGISLLAVSAAAGWALEAYGFPRGYGLAFLCGFALSLAGLLVLIGLREPAGLDVRAVPTGFRQRMRELPLLFRSDPDFVLFVRARLLATAARGSLPFYIVSITAAHGVSGTRLASLTIAFTLAQALAAALWGALGDRSGYRIVFLCGIACWVSGSLLVLLDGAFLLSYVIFFLVGAGLSAMMLAFQNLVLEFGTERDRPRRIATTHSLAEVVGMVGFFGAGLLAQTLSVASVFVAAAVLQLLAALALWRMDDPRRRIRGTILGPEAVEL